MTSEPPPPSPGLRADFIKFDDALARKGVPALTAWWRERIGTWLDAYERDGVLELWGAVGRGAAKSTALYKLALFFSLFGSFSVPVGERHYAIVLSRLREEAGKGVAIIARWLTLLRVTHAVAGDVIELADSPRGIRVVAASVAAATGWRAFFIGADEYAKWPTGGADTWDGAEVRSSAVAMTATHSNAPIVTMSTPWAAFGPFFDAINTGSDAHHVVIGPAPTWEAAPHVTRTDCERKETNKRRFEREYACVFASATNAVFPLENIDEARTLWTTLPVENASDPIMCIDASRGGDRFTWSVVRWVWAQGKARLKVDDVGGVPDATDTKGAVDWLVAKARAVGAVKVVGDQYDAAGLGVLFSERDTSFISIPWTNKVKTAGVDVAERLLRDHELLLPPDSAELRTEMLQYVEKLTKTGETTYGGRHDDFVAAAIITPCISTFDHHIPHVTPPPAVTRALSLQEAGAKIESAWVDQQTRAWQTRKEYERDMGAWSLDDARDELMYLP